MCVCSALRGVSEGGMRSMRGIVSAHACEYCLCIVLRRLNLCACACLHRLLCMCVY